MKHGRHVRDVADIPIGNIPDKWTIFEQPRHAGDSGDIDVVQIASRATFLHLDGNLSFQLRERIDNNWAKCSGMHSTIITGFLRPFTP